MKTPERDRRAYELARGYLPGRGIKGVSQPLVDKYLAPESVGPRPETINSLYERALESAQTSHMKAGVVGRAIDGGVKGLAPVLAGFDPKAVVRRYRSWESLFGEIARVVKPRGQMRQEPGSIWPLYCRTALSAAEFLSQFASADEFYSWVDGFDRDAKARASLPMLLDHEIAGFGFALACDFLKDLGYVGFPKPDVHLRHIFRGLALCGDRDDDYQVFKAIVRLAGHAGVTPYAADKVFWLIGSGYFHLDEHIGNKGRIGRHGDDFIRFARPELATFEE